MLMVGWWSLHRLGPCRQVEAGVEAKAEVLSGAMGGFISFIYEQSEVGWRFWVECSRQWRFGERRVACQLWRAVARGRRLWVGLGLRLLSRWRARSTLVLRFERFFVSVFLFIASQIALMRFSGRLRGRAGSAGGRFDPSEIGVRRL